VSSFFRILVLGTVLSACDDGGGGALFCRAEGEGYDVKVMEEGPCCDGLTAANTTDAPDADGVCQLNDLNPAKICIACDDGTCGEGENVCNCPEDCGE
jgi:hypothetical protein